MTRKNSVAVLMSTYNGEKHLGQQIDSLMKQTGVSLQLFIRDDGSADRTVEILNEYSKVYPNIHYTVGTNRGYANSFLELLLNTPDTYNYYCFADQDDIWKDDKISHAISKCEKSKGVNTTYVSALTYVDEHMNHIRTRDYSNEPVTLKSIFTRMRFAGCTMLFTRDVFSKCVLAIRVKGNQISTSHDQFVLAVCLASGGTIIVDHKSYIYYRRSDDSLTAGGGSLLKRCRYEKKRILTNDRLDSLSLLLLSSGIVTTQERRYLQNCSHYKQSLTKQILLALQCLQSTKNPILNLEALLKVFLKTF